MAKSTQWCVVANWFDGTTVVFGPYHSKEKAEQEEGRFTDEHGLNDAMVETVMMEH